MSMKTDHISNNRVVGGDYFFLQYMRKSNKTLQSYLDKFNRDDYHIVKATRNQKVVSYDELLDFKYSCYIFFFKEKYNIDNILEWVNLEIITQGFQFLVKPTPPFPPTNIIIKQ